MLGLGLKLSLSTAKSSAGGFTPASISGLTNWYQLKTGITDDSGVSEWLDQSGNGNDLTQTVSGNRPPYNSITGAVEFKADGDTLKLDTDTSLGAFTFFMVVELDTDTNPSGTYHGLWQGTFTNRMHLWGLTGNLFFDLNASDGVNTDGVGISAITNDPADNDKFVLMVTKSAASGATVKVYIDNAESFSDTDFDENIPVALRNFGYTQITSRFMNGNAYELGFYDSELSSSDRTDLYNDLVTRHSL